jgi:hypothetical protein
MIRYCTLFDRSFLSRGLALFRSIGRTHDDFTLYILALDEETASILRSLRDVRIVVTGLDDMLARYPELDSLRNSRTRGEFCWTLTPFLLQFCLWAYGLPDCIYIDADLFFFSSPTQGLAMYRGASVLLTEHRYTPRFDQTVTSGKYCVQYMLFKNDERGCEALEWWRQRCAEWCFGRMEGGKFGDQKYLDDWLSRFGGVEVLEDPGFGAAPWNIQEFAIMDSGDALLLVDRVTRVEHPLVFYHFHALRKCAKGYWFLGAYPITGDAKDSIYKRYTRELEEIERLYPSARMDESRLPSRDGTISALAHVLAGEAKSLVKAAINFMSIDRGIREYRAAFDDRMESYLRFSEPGKD